MLNLAAIGVYFKMFALSGIAEFEAFVIKLSVFITWVAFLQQFPLCFPSALSNVSGWLETGSAAESQTSRKQKRPTVGWQAIPSNKDVESACFTLIFSCASKLFLLIRSSSSLTLRQQGLASSVRTLSSSGLSHTPAPRNSQPSFGLRSFRRRVRWCMAFKMKN